MKPLHPESRGLLGEVFGLAEDLDGMRRSIDESVAIFQQMDRSGVSLQSMASVYHKLATAYLSVSFIVYFERTHLTKTIIIQKELSEDAIPLLQLSLEVLPSYLPALVDLTVAHFMNHDRDEAQKALSTLVALAPSHPSIGQFQKAIRAMK